MKALNINFKFLLTIFRAKVDSTLSVRPKAYLEPKLVR